MGSKRTYTVKEIKKLSRAESDLETNIGAGGSALLATGHHDLEGPEHTEKSGALLVRTVISPAQLVANTDNWNPTGLATADAIRASTDASRNLTGIVAPASGFQALVLANVGAFDLVLKHDATSTAANRLFCPNDTDMTLQKDSTAILIYDAATDRWRVIGGGGGGGGGGSLVVQEADVTVDGAATTLDFGHGLDVTSSPAGEANIAVDEGELTHNNLSGLTTGDPHTQYALDTDLAAHAAAGDPHSAYALDSDLSSHAGAADPHTGYQKESEKAAASGYASLDGSTKVPLAQLPTGTSSSTVALGDAAAALDATHAAAGDPHPGYTLDGHTHAFTDLTIDIQLFDTPGNATWTKPAGASTIEVICIGGGGGGGSGRRGTSGTGRYGGTGGGGGGMSRKLFDAGDLGSTAKVRVGAGGTGGTAVSANSTSGNDGTAGGDSYFGHSVDAVPDNARIGAGGGALGQRGLTTVPDGADPGIGNVASRVAYDSGAIFYNVNAAIADFFASGSHGNTGSDSRSGALQYACGGGGGGGGTGSGTERRGGAGGVPAEKFGHTPAARGEVHANGADGPTVTGESLYYGGFGGAGGGCSTTSGTPGGTGGAASKYGGGGGGGGAGTDGTPGSNSGAGGAGASGVVVVISR